MHRGDGGFDLEGTGPRRRQRRFEHARRGGDRLMIPARTILFWQWHRRSVWIETGAASRVVQLHEREQACSFGFLRKDIEQRMTETNGKAAQFGSDGVVF